MTVIDTLFYEQRQDNSMTLYFRQYLDPSGVHFITSGILFRLAPLSNENSIFHMLNNYLIIKNSKAKCDLKDKKELLKTL